MLYQEKWPLRPGAAPPEAPKIWGTGAYNTIIFGTTYMNHDYDRDLYICIRHYQRRLCQAPTPSPSTVLPSHDKIPSFFHPLLDGENGPSPESPIPFQATSNTPSSSHSHRLIPPAPCLLDRQSPPKAQAAASSLVSALAFLDVFQSASDTGKARLLDGSTQHGPSTWLVRIPKVERFRYFEQWTDPISTRAADLLACPPHLLDKNCLSCSFQLGLDRVPLGTDGRRFVHCRKGAPSPCPVCYPTDVSPRCHSFQ